MMAVKTVYIIKKLVHGFSYYLRLYGAYDRFQAWEGLKDNATTFESKNRATYIVENEIFTDDECSVIDYSTITQ